MDLKVLHSIMSRKGYHYFDGKTNSVNDNLYMEFSTGYNGRGDWVEIKIGSELHNIRYKDKNKNSINEFKDVVDNELFKILEKLD